MRVCYWNEYVIEGMPLDFTELAVRRFEVENFDIRRIFSITNKRAISAPLEQQR